MPGASRFIGATTAPPPCQAVTTNQRAPSAALAGRKRAVTTTSRCGGGATSCTLTVARGSWEPLGIGSAHVITATAASPAAGTSHRGALLLRSRGATERPIQAPSTPPAVPATRAQVTPSAISDGGHGM